MSSSVLREYQGADLSVYLFHFHLQLSEFIAETPVVELLTPYAGPPTVIIDTDPGIDDAMALLLAFAAHKRKEISIIGITIVIGNNGDQELLAR